MTSRGLLTTASVRDFFETAIAEAIKRQELTPDEATAAYLVDLLCEYMTHAAPPLDRPLGVVMAQSEANLTEPRLHQLKQVGDQALYVAGFFGQSLRRRQLDVEYYATLGGTAYRRLSELLDRRGDAPRLCQVYGELSTDFPEFVEVLAEVRGSTDGTATDVGSLYEQWLQTGQRAVERRLHQAGMHVVRRSAGLPEDKN
ncbi:MAG: hypothetical protein IT371_07175 [Deltaproteobacteria bacterium]|nr:hypothetical protein [Deltaproteobacteria bacterium]